MRLTGQATNVQYSHQPHDWNLPIHYCSPVHHDQNITRVTPPLASLWGGYALCLDRMRLAMPMDQASRHEPTVFTLALPVQHGWHLLSVLVCASCLRKHQLLCALKDGGPASSGVSAPSRVSRAQDPHFGPIAAFSRQRHTFRRRDFTSMRPFEAAATEPLVCMATATPYSVRFSGRDPCRMGMPLRLV